MRRIIKDLMKPKIDTIMESLSDDVKYTVETNLELLNQIPDILKRSLEKDSETLDIKVKSIVYIEDPLQFVIDSNFINKKNVINVQMITDPIIVPREWLMERCVGFEDTNTGIEYRVRLTKIRESNINGKELNAPSLTYTKHSLNLLWANKEGRAKLALIASGFDIESVLAGQYHDLEGLLCLIQ